MRYVASEFKQNHWDNFFFLQLAQGNPSFHFHAPGSKRRYIIIIIINPLTARVVGAPQMIFCNQFSPFFPVLHCPFGLAELQACPFPGVVFPPLPLSALSSSPFHCALQDGFGQTWWTGNITIPLQFASFYDRQEIFMRSYCLLDLG